MARPQVVPDHVKRVVDHFVKHVASTDINAHLPARFFYRNNHDDSLCDIFGVECLADRRDQRYADCVLFNIPIELKKTRDNAFWMDEVRYSEMYVKKKRLSGSKDIRPIAGEKSVVVFLKNVVTRWNRRVLKIYCIDTDCLFDLLKLDDEVCRTLLTRHEQLRKISHRANSQHCITVRDLMETGQCVEIDVPETNGKATQRVRFEENSSPRTVPEMQLPKVSDVVESKEDPPHIDWSEEVEEDETLFVAPEKEKEEAKPRKEKKEVKAEKPVKEKKEVKEKDEKPKKKTVKEKEEKPKKHAEKTKEKKTKEAEPAKKTSERVKKPKEAEPKKSKEKTKDKPVKSKRKAKE